MNTKLAKKVKRQIIKIDEDKCTGCGECIPNCPEGALQVIDGKARLISDLFCDGLGACIGHCPEGAIITEEREAEPYEEKTVMANIIKQGKNVILAHLEHLKGHGQDEYYQQAVDFLKEKGIAVPAKEEKHQDRHTPCACPGSAMRSFEEEVGCPSMVAEKKPEAKVKATLSQWPVQLMLVPPNAPFLQNRDLVLAADCVSYAYGNFHNDFLKGKALLIACPKLDDTEYYLDKLTQMFRVSDIKSINVLHMEVPCCTGLVVLAKKALQASGKKIPLKETTIGIRGDILGESVVA